MPKIDLPEVSSAKPGRYVTIPEIDLFGMPHPGVRLNVDAYLAGETYFLDPERANTVEATLKGYDESIRRTLMSTQDMVAIRAVEKGSGRGLERVAPTH